MSEVRSKWWAFVNTVISNRVLSDAGNFLISCWLPVNFSGRTLVPLGVVIFNVCLTSDHTEKLCFIQSYQYWTFERLKHDNIIEGSVRVRAVQTRAYTFRSRFDFSLSWRHHVVTRVGAGAWCIVVQCPAGARFCFFSKATWSALAATRPTVQ